MKRKRPTSTDLTKLPAKMADENAAPERDVTTFSIRLTDEQRDLLARAAELKGWTPTNLIRTATLERAAHIVNTSRLTKFNFKGLANRIADRLFQPLPCECQISNEDLQYWTLDLPEADSPRIVRGEVGPWPISSLFEFKQAARLGGSEFLNLVLEFSEAMRASERADLPEPIDPGTTAL